MPVLLVIAIPLAILVIISTVFLYILEKSILTRLEEIDPDKKKELVSVTGRAKPRLLNRFLKEPDTDDHIILSKVRIYKMATLVSIIPVAALILTIIFLF